MTQSTQASPPDADPGATAAESQAAQTTPPPLQAPSKTARTTSWAALAISTASLVTAIYAARTSKDSYQTAVQQLHVAESAYKAALAQLGIATKAALTAENSFRLAKDQFEFVKQNQLDENSFPIVYSREFLDSIGRPLGNKTTIPLSFTNNTKRALGYRVAIETEGFGVFFENLIPEQLFFKIYLDRNIIVVPPDGSPYANTFVVWHSTKPPATGKLRILVNDKTVLERSYDYDVATQSYLPRGG